MSHLPNNPNQKEKNIYPTDGFFGDGYARNLLESQSAHKKESRR